MSVKLTPAEVQYARKWIKRLEANAGIDRWLRWFELLAAFFLIGTAIYVSQVLNYAAPRLLSPTEPADAKIDAPTMRYYVETRILQEEFRLTLPFVWLPGIAGGLGLLFIMLQWDRHLSDTLVAKLLRRQLEEELREPPSVTAP